MAVSAKRFDNDIYRLFDGNGVQLGTAIRYSNDVWWMHDGEDKRLDEYGSHASPKALARALGEALENAQAAPAPSGR